MELPPSVTLAFALALGAVIGSFLNVVILRTISGKALTGRSHCPHCKATLTAVDLIPVLSFIFLWGRCRTCRKPISMQYPLVELATAATFAIIAWYTAPFASAASLILFALYASFAALSIAIAVIDFKTTIIPDRLSIVLAGVSFSIALILGIQEGNLVVRVLAGPLIAAPFALLWLVSQGRWIGLGDAKYAISLGWLLGLSLGTTAVMFAFWIGALVSVSLIAVAEAMKKYHHRIVNSGALLGTTKRLTIRSEVPFAPFLIMATAIVSISGFDLIAFLLF